MANIFQHIALHPFVQSSYSSPYSLFWHDRVVLQDAEGQQDGDPLDPLLLACPYTTSAPSWSQSSVYGTWMTAPWEDIRHGLEIVPSIGSELGLHSNHQKSEVITTNPATANPIMSAIPGVQVLDPASATLLDSPIEDVSRRSSMTPSHHYGWKTSASLHTGCPASSPQLICHP